MTDEKIKRPDPLSLLPLPPVIGSPIDKVEELFERNPVDEFTHMVENATTKINDTADKLDKMRIRSSK